MEKDAGTEFTFSLRKQSAKIIVTERKTPQKPVLKRANGKFRI
jgi:hypothetical protein